MHSNAEREANTQSNQSRSLFLLLPPELRNRTYEFACVETRAHIRETASRDTSPRVATAFKLIQICRQIRDEAFDIMYSFCVLDISHAAKLSSFDRSQFLDTSLCTSIRIASIDRPASIGIVGFLTDDSCDLTCKVKRDYGCFPSLQRVQLEWIDQLLVGSFLRPTLRSKTEKAMLSLFTGLCFKV